MVIVEFDPSFERRIMKIKNQSVKNRLKKHIKKIINNPFLGKPMKYDLKGTREVYISSFRLSYAYILKENRIIFLDLYPKDEQ